MGFTISGAFFVGRNSTNGSDARQNTALIVTSAFFAGGKTAKELGAAMNNKDKLITVTLTEAELHFTLGCISTAMALYLSHRAGKHHDTVFFLEIFTRKIAKCGLEDQAEALYQRLNGELSR